ncbi:MAG: type II toxin-antitoxin system VapC family toxin [Caldilinea sp. CFX5]|nr:type II toxin-antitoxin system VapC family toxin [Caldilinea sp. CFX5]
MRYILDTDHITLYREGNLMVRSRIATVGNAALHVTIISFQEQVEGWFAEIRRAQNQQRLLWAYGKLHQTFIFFTRMQILPFDEPAAIQFQQLYQQRLRVGTQDLRIAAIALAHGCTVVTRNHRDFARIPELAIADWSVAIN